MTAARPSAEVDVVTLRPTTLEDRHAVVGTVRAQREVVVSGRVVGHIRSISVEEGQTVRAGQPLVTLDDRELRAGVAATAAGVRAAESAILAAEQAVVTARSQLRLAELTHGRYTDLLLQESVSQQEFDIVQAGVESAVAALGSAEAGVAQTEAARAQAAAVADAATLSLSYAVVASPLSGVVTQRLVDPGALATPGAPLLRIEETGSYRLEVAVPESRDGGLALGEVVPLEVDAPWAARLDAALTGAIVEIVPAVDPRSRTFTVKVALPDLPGIRSGQFGRVLLPGPTRQGLLVPASAVDERGQLRVVWVEQDGYARRRAVTLGDARDAFYDVRSGLQAGDRVIVEPAGLRDGDPVSAREATL